MKKVLFVSVHPDDETLGCGGTILKHKRQGDQLFWLIISGPTNSHPYGFSEEMIKKRETEIKRVSLSYGFEKIFNLGFPTQMLDEVPLREMVVAIDKAIKEIEPSDVYLVNRSDVHSDHRIAFDAIYACTKSYHKPFIERIMMYETLSETEYSPALTENAFVPNAFVDISDFMNKKIEIMKIYETELMPENYSRSISSIKSLARYRGSRIGVKYAEAFMLLFEKK
jgi:LmbE family N-acetylglucosaminyl deacetylase